ncbi:MAG TPA: biotin synthase, partial [Spirochaetota bacterium]|nr:biotin synthase [Spirochaetota bacterium]
VRSAKKIVFARRVTTLRFDDLKKIGVVLKRAKYFLTCNGAGFGKNDYNELSIKTGLLTDGKDKNTGQLLLFSDRAALPDPESVITAATGEL